MLRAEHCGPAISGERDLAKTHRPLLLSLNLFDPPNRRDIARASWFRRSKHSGSKRHRGSSTSVQRESSNVDPDDDIITPTLRRLALDGQRVRREQRRFQTREHSFFRLWRCKWELGGGSSRLEQSTSSLGPLFARSRPIAGKILRRSEGSEV